MPAEVNLCALFTPHTRANLQIDRRKDREHEDAMRSYSTKKKKRGFETSRRLTAGRPNDYYLKHEAFPESLFLRFQSKGWNCKSAKKSRSGDGNVCLGLFGQLVL